VFENDSDAYREEFLHAVEVARALHNPAEDWVGFRDTLWTNLTRVFGIDDLSAQPDPLDADLAAGTGVPGLDLQRPADGVGQRSAATPRV
jgi:hypothetical protein